MGDNVRILKPTVALKSVTDITPKLLEKLGTDAILLDVDNTLAPPTSHIPYEGVKPWIENIKNNAVFHAKWNIEKKDDNKNSTLMYVGIAVGSALATVICIAIVLIVIKKKRVK